MTVINRVLSSGLKYITAIKKSRKISETRFKISERFLFPSHLPDISVARSCITRHFQLFIIISLRLFVVYSIEEVHNRNVKHQINFYIIFFKFIRISGTFHHTSRQTWHFYQFKFYSLSLLLTSSLRTKKKMEDYYLKLNSHIQDQLKQIQLNTYTSTPLSPFAKVLSKARSKVIQSVPQKRVFYTTTSITTTSRNIDSNPVLIKRRWRRLESLLKPLLIRKSFFCIVFEI